jgi:hypothetical protein
VYSGPPAYPTGAPVSPPPNRTALFVGIAAAAVVLVVVVAAIVVAVVLRGGTPTTTPTGNPTSPPVSTTTTEPTSTATSGEELDFSLTPNFGSHSLSTGFTPDPWTLELTSGGSLNSSSVGCTGWVTAAPDAEVSWSGTSSFLRIFVTASEDTTLIINDPAGQWHCSDDVYGSNPAIDFSSPTEGTYDIWVGSYSSDDFISSTLYVTELTSVDPNTVQG